jgi:hypothetical protein
MKLDMGGAAAVLGAARAVADLKPGGVEVGRGRAALAPETEPLSKRPPSDPAPSPRPPLYDSLCASHKP